MTEAPRPYDRRAVTAWCLYDFANSSYTTLVVTFIYATYFTKGIAANEVVGTELWSRGVTLTALAVALLSPYVGAVADRGGYRKRFLFISTAVCIAGTVLLFWPGPGEIYQALLWFVVSNVAFEMGNVFYNAYLPDIAPPARIGRISGYGWGLGYVGGLLCLVLALLLFVNPEEPLFGLSKETGAHVRGTNLLVAVWFAVFSVPLFLFVRDRPVRAMPAAGNLIRSATRQLSTTFHEVRRYRQIFRLLLARLFYNDGLITIFAFGGIYAAGTFGFTTEDIIVFGIVINVAAGLGAFLFGFVDDRIGGKPTILISIALLFVATLLATLATSPLLFWVAAVLIGLCAGPNQAASRSLLGRFVPLDKENEFYGFYAFSGKATAFMGPFLLGLLTGLFESQRAGVASVLLFFVVGGLLLLRVDERAGAAVAGRTAAS